MNGEEQNKSDKQSSVENITEYTKNIELEESENSVQSDELDPRDDLIKKLETKLNEIQVHERDNMLRMIAEMENLRRRTRQEIEQAHKFALERFINELLPVIDSLDLALEVAAKDDKNISAVIEGIKLTHKSMLDVIGKFGITVINNIDVPLDPNIHQAIAMVESEKITAGNVLNIMQKGYTLNGRTIRAAIVTVAKCTSLPT